MMAAYESAEQMREARLRDMGPRLGEVYNSVWNDVGWLHAKWLQFRQLYAHSPERIDLLNEIAGHFFGLVQAVLWDDVILHIARLTEKSKTMGKANLTLAALPPLIGDLALQQDVATLVATATSEAAFARQWRNKRLAHRDLQVALTRRADSLPGISRQAVERALGAIQAVLNRLERHYWQSEVVFSRMLAVGQADELVYYLRLALHLEAKRRERIEQGKYVPEDFEEPPDD